jgi:hypothetical protein
MPLRAGKEVAEDSKAEYTVVVGVAKATGRGFFSRHRGLLSKLDSRYEREEVVRFQPPDHLSYRN